MKKNEHKCAEKKFELITPLYKSQLNKCCFCGNESDATLIYFNGDDKEFKYFCEFHLRKFKNQLDSDFSKVEEFLDFKRKQEAELESFKKEQRGKLLEKQRNLFYEDK